MKKASDLLLESATPFDEGCTKVKQLEESVTSFITFMDSVMDEIRLPLDCYIRYKGFRFVAQESGLVEKLEVSEPNNTYTVREMLEGVVSEQDKDKVFNENTAPINLFEVVKKEYCSTRETISELFNQVYKGEGNETTPFSHFLNVDTVDLPIRNNACRGPGLWRITEGEREGFLLTWKVQYSATTGVLKNVIHHLTAQYIVNPSESSFYIDTYIPFMDMWVRHTHYEILDKELVKLSLFNYMASMKEYNRVAVKDDKVSIEE